MAIKVKTGKLELGKPIDEFIENFIKSYKCKILDISLPHVYQTIQYCCRRKILRRAN